jgi:hypothetical protein
MVREHLPRFVSPMLARSGLPSNAEGWAYMSSSTACAPRLDGIVQVIARQQLSGGFGAR